MRKMLPLIAIIFLTASCNFKETVNGDGNITEKRFPTGTYDELDVEGNFSVEIIDDTTADVTVKTDSNLMEHVVIEEKSGVLVIKPESGFQLSPSGNLIVKVPKKRINGIELTGSGSIKSSQTISAKKVEFEISGSGDIDTPVEANAAEFKSTGSGNIVVSGKAKKTEIRMTGSGSFKGKDFTTKNVDGKLTGSGDIIINLDNAEVDMDMSGSGDFIYSGTVSEMKYDKSGSGEVIQK